MKNRLELKTALRDLANASPREASASGEIRLVEAFRRKQRKARFGTFLWLAAAACLIVILGWLSSYRFISRERSLSAGSESYQHALAGFVPLPYAQSGVPIEQAVIVRVELAPSQFEAFGISEQRVHSRTPLQAELLVGQDGVARAVRLAR